MPAPRQFEAVSAAVSPNLVDIECDGLMAALGVQFLRSLKRLVRQLPGYQLLDDAVVDVQAFGLEDQLGIVPVEAKPAEVFQ